uniref:Late embryogenesis abundant protein LEA-2 subgroup domain-containing protein n=1 Tax=Leersia perrieri TaxID=77586 RepID=A0A0D9WL69_9ORYZ
MAAAAEEKEEEEEKFRWLDVVRYAAAAVVAMLAVAVVVGAILVVLRPDALDISVSHGSVLAELLQPNSSSSSVKVMFRFRLFATNPSGRAAISFLNVSIAVSAAGGETIPAIFRISGVDSLPPDKVMDWTSEQTSSTDPAADLGEFFFSQLSDGKNIGRVTLRIHGLLVTAVVGTLNSGGELHRLHTNKAAETTYTCSDVIITVDRSLQYKGDDVSCTRRSSYI